MSLLESIATCRVLPVVVVNDAKHAVKLSQVLLSAGMSAIEITLRSPRALECIAAVKSDVPDMIVAAGTVRSSADLVAASAAGADFMVSPGISEALIRSASARDRLLIPGVATASELMLGMAYGISVFKLFPAEAVGGMALLKSLAGPFPDAHFCPTGGLSPDNFRDYLALDNVVCVGGSWMVKESLIAGEQWPQIENLARATMQ